MASEPVRDEGYIDMDRTFMQMAVDEARKSIAEDARAHPKVGAVVVKDGKVLATAHRGELESGGHAEYTALELLPRAGYSQHRSIAFHSR